MIEQADALPQNNVNATMPRLFRSDVVSIIRSRSSGIFLLLLSVFQRMKLFLFLFFSALDSVQVFPYRLNSCQKSGVRNLRHYLKASTGWCQIIIGCYQIEISGDRTIPPITFGSYVSDKLTIIKADISVQLKKSKIFLW